MIVRSNRFVALFTIDNLIEIKIIHSNTFEYPRIFQNETNDQIKERKYCL